MAQKSGQATAAYAEAQRQIELCRRKGALGKLLDLSDLKLTQLPPEIGQLKYLTELSVFKNLLTSLPKEIGSLSALTALRLWDNELTSLPPEIGQLTHLTELDLRNNKLESLPTELCNLASLTELGLSNNQLNQLPAELEQLNLRGLYLHDNPDLLLTNEVLGPTWNDRLVMIPASPQAILKTYFALQRGQQPLHEVKLVLIGRGGVGKSSLVRALMKKPFEEKQEETTGIAIGKWTLNCHGVDVIVHLWDFAGQECTHEAHRFFLTERCLYLVVTEGRMGLQDVDVDHWLAHVEQYGSHVEPGKPPQTSPALIVANKIELSPAPLEKNRLQREHRYIKGFLETDCKSNRGIDQLRQKICDIIASPEMDNVRQPFPIEWRRMLILLEDWKKLNRHYFTFAEFATECKKHGVQDGDQMALTHVLNQLGIALYYGQNPRLNDTRVLDPQWLANGMYALIRGVEKHGDPKHPGEMRKDEVELRLAQGLDLMKGELFTGDLTLADYPETPVDTRSFLLELMEDRDLCFEDKETSDGVPVYLLPGLLPKDEPPDVDFDSFQEPSPDQARLRISYKLLPDGLLPRFIVRTHSLSVNLHWRRGVVLEWAGAGKEAREPARALIVADMQAKRIEVSVRGGNEKLRLELVGMVRTHLKNIHLELPRALGAREELEMSPQGEQWQRIEKLELAAQQGKHVQVQVGQQLEELPPEKELQKVEPESAWQKDADEHMLRIFISYSHKDHKYLKSLTSTYLAVLENEKLVQKWTDGELRAGENWDERIRDKIHTADIIILMVSEHFFASQYIRGVEMKLARERLARGEARIFPVLLEGDSWQQYDWLKDLHWTPKHPGNARLIPLRDYAPQSLGWEAVQRALRDVIKELRAQRNPKQPPFKG